MAAERASRASQDLTLSSADYYCRSRSAHIVSRTIRCSWPRSRDGWRLDKEARILLNELQHERCLLLVPVRCRFTASQGFDVRAEPVLSPSALRLFSLGKDANLAIEGNS